MITKKQIETSNASLVWTKEIPAYDAKKDKSLTSGSWLGRKITLVGKVLVHIAYSIAKLAVGLFFMLSTLFSSDAFLLAKWGGFSSMRHLQYSAGALVSCLGFLQGRRWMHRAREHIYAYNNAMPSQADKKSQHSPDFIDEESVPDYLKESVKQCNKTLAESKEILEKAEQERKEKERRLARANAVNAHTIQHVNFSQWRDDEIEHLFGFSGLGGAEKEKLFSLLTKEQINAVALYLSKSSTGIFQLSRLLSQKKGLIAKLELDKIDLNKLLSQLSASIIKEMTFNQKCYIVQQFEVDSFRLRGIISEMELQNLNEAELRSFVEAIGYEKAFDVFSMVNESSDIQKIISKLTDEQFNRLIADKLEKEKNYSPLLKRLKQQITRLDLTKINVDHLIYADHEDICEHMSFEQKLCIVSRCKRATLVIIKNKLGLEQMSPDQKQKLFEAAGDKRTYLE